MSVVVNFKPEQKPAEFTNSYFPAASGVWKIMESDTNQRIGELLLVFSNQRFMTLVDGKIHDSLRSINLTKVKMIKDFSVESVYFYHDPNPKP